MTRIPEEVIEEIKQTVTLERLLKEMYGKEITPDHKTICDFHDDHSPSLHIFPDGGYKCFVCGAGKRGQELVLPDGTTITDGGNDIFGYVMNKERVDFHEAIRMIGEFAGIEVPEEKPDPEALKMKQLVTEKNREFYKALMKDEDALAYLRKRGIDQDDIAKWRIGMVPWDWADKRYVGRIVFGMIEPSYQPDKAYTIAMAYRVREYEDYLKHGWLKDEMDKYLYARYHEDGRLKSLNPKYYNDASSKIYNKSQYLYGLTYAQVALREMPEEKRYMVVMEGYTDVILAHKHGLETAVACCSSTISDEQADIISKKCKKVYLWLDGDEAGMNGMTRSLPKLLSRGCEVLIVYSPGMDPAEVVLAGYDLTEYIVKHAKPAVQLIINQHLDQYDRVMTQTRTKVLEALLPLIDSIARPADRIHYRSLLESRLHVRI